MFVGSKQLPQMIDTSFVALTLAPHRGQIYFRVLDGFFVVVPVGVVGDVFPVFPPVGGTKAKPPSCRVTLISARSFSMHHSISLSVGVVIVHP